METTELRGMVRASWAAVATKWGEYAEALEAHEAGLTAAMLEAASVKPGDRVLELACGPGGLGLAAAEAVGPEGTVVVSDVVDEMAGIAAARAAARGFAHVRPRTLDLEAIDEPDNTYDVVLCRQGLMFAVDQARAVSEIGRVLAPGGRAAIAVWGPRTANPWLGLVMDAVGATVGRPVPPPGIPGPFDLDDRDRLHDLFVGAGLRDVTVEDVADHRHWPSFNEWWAWTSALAGPLATILAAMPDETVTAITDRLRAAAAPYTTDDGVALPSLAFVASARKS